MFVLGHLGIGLALARPFVVNKLRQRRSTWAWIFFGALLPDLIDKPLYYSNLFGLPGTRTFGHSLLVLCVLVVLAVRARTEDQRTWIALGASGHIVLDHLIDMLGGLLTQVNPPLFPAPTLIGFLWPLLGTEFPIAPFANMREHADSFFQPVFYYEECVGFLFLCLFAFLDLRAIRKAQRNSRSG